MENYQMDPTISYDVVTLPSRGIYYPNKKKSVKVAYLTAADENILSSQNLIQNKTVIEELLKRKVIDKEIKVEDIVDEDRHAILIFLRNTAWGPEYEVNVYNSKTEKKEPVKIDLSELEFKEFNLTEDENEEFQYTLPKNGNKITFKFLTKKQENELKEIEKTWNGNGVPPIITRRLEMLIKSVDGNRDPMAIRQFIENKFDISDSQKFRKYVNENKPGLNLSKEVTTPSGEKTTVNIGFGVEFFRPFLGI